MSYIDPHKYGKVPFNRIEPGDVIFAHVPYREDPTVLKTRPVVLVEKKGRSIMACPLYTSERQGTIKTIRHNRTSYIDPRAIEVDRYHFVSYDPEPLDDATWDILADSVIWPEEQ